MKDNETELIFFGRLEERKGLFEFVAALHHLRSAHPPAFRVTFVGKVVPLYQAALQGADSETFLRRELSGKIDFTILGDLDSRAAIDYVRSAREAVVCLASPSDNFPNAALEMGQVPRRLVVSDTMGFHQTLGLIGRTEALYWFKPGCSLSLAAALRSALEADGADPQAPTAPEIERLNNGLLRQRLELLNEAAIAKQEPHSVAPARISAAIVMAAGANTARRIRRSLLALSRGQRPPRSIVVACSGLARSSADKLRTRFPQVVFADQSAASLQEIVRAAIGSDTRDGDYVALLLAGAALKAQALANLSKAGQSNPALIISAEDVLGRHTLIETFEPPTVSMLVRSNRSCGSCLTVSTDFLDSLPPLDWHHPRLAMWSLVLAASAQGRRVAYLPLPQHSVRPPTAFGSEAPTDDELAALWQYLSKFDPGVWSRREIRNLVLSVQQLATQARKLHRELLRANAELEKAGLAAGQAASATEQSRQELADTREELSRTAADLQETKSVLGQLLASRSWQLTRPLRSLAAEKRKTRAALAANPEK